MIVIRSSVCPAAEIAAETLPSAGLLEKSRAPHVASCGNHTVWSTPLPPMTSDAAAVSVIVWSRGSSRTSSASLNFM
jgi:hypothetical protein